MKKQQTWGFNPKSAAYLNCPETRLLSEQGDSIYFPVLLRGWGRYCKSGSAPKRRKEKA